MGERRVHRRGGVTVFDCDRGLEVMELKPDAALQRDPTRTVHHVVNKLILDIGVNGDRSGEGGVEQFAGTRTHVCKQLPDATAYRMCRTSFAGSKVTR